MVYNSWSFIIVVRWTDNQIITREHLLVGICQTGLNLKLNILTCPHFLLTHLVFLLTELTWKICRTTQLAKGHQSNDPHMCAECLELHLWKPPGFGSELWAKLQLWRSLLSRASNWRFQVSCFPGTFWCRTAFTTSFGYMQKSSIFFTISCNLTLLRFQINQL